jgi:hypothetical protein
MDFIKHQCVIHCFIHDELDIARFYNRICIMKMNVMSNSWFVEALVSRDR